MKNKPFDKEKALSGMECLSARGDSAYYKFTVNNHKDGKFHVFKLIEASTLSEAAIYVDDDGYVYAGGSNARLPESDLFMAPEKQTVWVNMWRDIATGIIRSSDPVIESEEKARAHMSATYHNYIGTYPIEIEL